MYITSFLINEKDNQQILKVLKENFSLKEENPTSKNQTFYDTFDSSLQKNDFILYNSGINYILQPILSKSTIKPIIFNHSKKIFFWQDFPTEHLRNFFKNLIGIRSIIPFSTLKNCSHYLNVIDEEEKIVAKILIETFLDKNQNSLLKIITLKPIKGYSKYYNKIYELFKSLDYLTPITQKNFIKELVKRNEIIPLDYSSKPAKISNPNMQTSEAIIRLFTSLVKVLEINKNGVINDTDSEFLHDFRVSIRRSRSIISLLKIAFNPSEIQPYKEEFAKLASATNKLRDYDVYLLNKDIYQAILPSHLHQGLHQFFINIKKKKKYEHKKLVTLLNSENYDLFINKWKNVLDNNNDIFNKQISLVPIVELACKNIFTRFKKVLKKGSKINHNSPDEVLHNLRLDCKKLRYLVEFFSDLFPKQDISILISQLKKLQDCLGEFNDYSIQQIHLEEYLSSINHSAPNSIELSATIGALISASYQEKQKRRNSFFDIFKTFASTDNINLYIKLFNN